MTGMTNNDRTQDLPFDNELGANVDDMMAGTIPIDDFKTKEDHVMRVDNEESLHQHPTTLLFIKTFDN